MSYAYSCARCPHCDGETHQDHVDVGVGVIHGPRGCIECGWSEDAEYDQRNPENRKSSETGGYKDQFGGYHPAGSTRALALRLADSLSQAAESLASRPVGLRGPFVVDNELVERIAAPKTR